MTILVTGKNGQLGSELEELVSHHTKFSFLFTDQAELDITDKAAVNHFFEQRQIDAVINCAAYTAVDKAESEPELANAVNHLGVRYLAEACKMYDVKLVHISTDYVFDGIAKKPYKEDDNPNPQGVYGHSKLAGELAIKAVNPRQSIIIRTSWLYSSYGSNFVRTMLRLGREKQQLNVVDDQIGSPTYAQDLAKAVLELLPKLDNPQVEIFHYANSGSCSWYDFAKAIFKITALDCKVMPIPSSQYPTPAKRPQYSVLDTNKIRKRFKMNIPDWETSLKKCLSHLP